MPKLMTVKISGQQHLGNLSHQRKMLCVWPVSGFSSNSSNRMSQCKLDSWIKSGWRLLRERKPHLVYSPTMYWLLHIHKWGLHRRKGKKSSKTLNYRGSHQTKTGTTLTATREPHNFHNHCFRLNLLFEARRAPTPHTQANEQDLLTHRSLAFYVQLPVSLLSFSFHTACIPAAASETEALPQPHVAFLPLSFSSLCS